MRPVPWSTDAQVPRPRANEDMFANAKAQAWWALRDRFLETFKASRGEPYDPDAIISLFPAIEELRELKSELIAGDLYLQRSRQGHREQSARRPLLHPTGPTAVMIAFAPVNRRFQLIGIFGSDGSVWEPDKKIWG